MCFFDSENPHENKNLRNKSSDKFAINNPIQPNSTTGKPVRTVPKLWYLDTLYRTLTLVRLQFLCDSVGFLSYRGYTRVRLQYGGKVELFESEKKNLLIM